MNEHDTDEHDTAEYDTEPDTADEHRITDSDAADERDTDLELSSNRRKLLRAVGAAGFGTAVGTYATASASASDATTADATAASETATDATADSTGGFEVRESVELREVAPSEVHAETVATAFEALSASAKSAIETARADGRYEQSGTLPSGLYGTQYVRRDGTLYRVHVATADVPPSKQ